MFFRVSSLNYVIYPASFAKAAGAPRIERMPGQPARNVSVSKKVRRTGYPRPARRLAGTIPAVALIGLTQKIRPCVLYRRS